MTQELAADQREQTVAWDRQCKKLAYRCWFFAVLGFPLQLALGGAVVWLKELVMPLVTGHLVFGEVGYLEYQEGKDVLLVAVAILLVLNAAFLGFLHVWYKKGIRALGPRPGGLPGKWKRWAFSL
ncbi:hypothetical protein QF031_003066 [Pseudarthrobacter defluvii]|uniref:hypothetical protein n=1 Tax=Pseudarthrobacter defluvii TaxID=410837 RepID=UPI0027885962|nr:hypothetical protein [Pseudarthrobacter defluvii]MDQ0770317.1 hypothetical protein [Pseudarthrobacter defluvii]